MTAEQQRSSSYGEQFKNLLFSKLYVQKQCSQCSCSCVETLVRIRAKFHVVPSLFSVLSILMLASECPCTPFKVSLPKNETTLNLKSASLAIIMHVHESLIHIQSQIKPRLLFWQEFYFKAVPVLQCIWWLKVSCWEITKRWTRHPSVLSLTLIQPSVRWVGGVIPPEVRFWKDAQTHVGRSVFLHGSSAEHFRLEECGSLWWRRQLSISEETFFPSLFLFLFF